MDRALKERVIGAIVLVGVAVLVVPVFLDGPPSDTEIVSKAVALPGQNREQGMMQTVVLTRDRDEPVPTHTPPPEDATQEPAKVAPPAPEEEAKEASPGNDTAPVVTEESATGLWAVQLGSFLNQQNAERLAADLRDEGYAAFLSKRDSGSGELHRVRIGPQKDRDSAEAVAAQLEKSGHTGQVVTHP